MTERKINENPAACKYNKRLNDNIISKKTK